MIYLDDLAFTALEPIDFTVASPPSVPSPAVPVAVCIVANMVAASLQPSMGMAVAVTPPSSNSLSMAVTVTLPSSGTEVATSFALGSEVLVLMVLRAPTRCLLFWVLYSVQYCKGAHKYTLLLQINRELYLYVLITCRFVYNYTCFRAKTCVSIYTIYQDNTVFFQN